MQIGPQNYPFSDVVETRVQTPTKTKAVNVQIGPGDPISNIPVVMEFEHHQVHEGETHIAQDAQIGLNTGTVKYSITVPASKFPHMVLQCQIFGSVARVDLYEGATFTSGSAVTAYNRNRNSAITPSITINTGVTSTNGTLIESFYAGSGTKSSAVSRSSSELILKANTIYRVDLIGQAAGCDAIMQFNWYEDLGV